LATSHFSHLGGLKATGSPKLGFGSESQDTHMIIAIKKDFDNCQFRLKAGVGV